MAAGTNHPAFKQPKSKRSSVWRYMSFARFVWLLSRRVLYFRRADLFDDPYEGYYTKPMSSPESLAAWIASMAADPKMNEEVVRAHFKNSLELIREGRKDFFLSCWHLNDAESAAMWKVYAPLHEAVCIRTSYLSLVTSLPNWVDVGLVNYRDYARHSIDPGNVFNLIMSKRLSFAHEKEVRAVVWLVGSDVPKPPDFVGPGNNGLLVKVDPSELIEEVYLSPTSASDFGEAVEGVASRFGLKVPVRQSEVNAPPAY